MELSLPRALGIIADVRKRELGGRALIIGRFDCRFSFNQLLVGMSKNGMLTLSGGIGGGVATVSAKEKAVADEFAANGRRFSGATDSGGNQFITDEFFFRFIGFDSVVGVDQAIGNAPGAGNRVAFDLGELGLAEIAGQNQLVYDVGTLEGVFHTVNMLHNIFDALSVGGYVFHHAATNNLVDRGFYQFSPKFFWDYYTVNGYGDVEVYLARGYGGRHEVRSEVENLFAGTTTPNEYRVPYTRGSLDQLSRGGFDDAIYSTACYAKKLATSTFGKSPPPILAPSAPPPDGG